jgi:hypothetical protein
MAFEKEFKMDKKSFIRSGEGAVSSYEWTDVAEGTGMIRFDGFTTKEQTTISHLLSNKPLYSHTQHTLSSAFGGGAAPMELRGTINFDLSPFNTPRTVAGTAFFNLTTQVGRIAGALSADIVHYVIVKVYKWDGTTATLIGSTTGEEIAYGMGAQYSGGYEQVLKAVCSQTNFKKGEILRVTVELWGSSTHTGMTIWLAHSPDDTKETVTPIITTDKTRFTADIPFRIDL